jgi:phage shock protein A
MSQMHADKQKTERRRITICANLRSSADNTLSLEVTMRLIKRIRCLLAANINDLVDHCENPEKMLRQAVREMETALGQLMDSAARAIAHEKLLTRQLQEQHEAIARRKKSASAAVASGDDDAARRELRFKAENQELADALAKQLESAEVLSQRLRTQVSAMRIKLAEARRKLVDITARNRAAAARKKFATSMSGAEYATDTWSNFAAMCARVEQTEAETEALLDLLGAPECAKSLDAEIEAELRALKEGASHVAC